MQSRFPMAFATTVRDLIADFIATLAVRLPQWLAEAGLTLGIATPVVISQVAALVGRWANKIQHFVRALLNSLRRLHPMLDKLGQNLIGLNVLVRRLSASDTPNIGEHPVPATRPPTTAPAVRLVPARPVLDGTTATRSLRGGRATMSRPMPSCSTDIATRATRTNPSRSGRSGLPCITCLQRKGRRIASSWTGTAVCVEPTTAASLIRAAREHCTPAWAGRYSSWTGTAICTRP